jgi:hypothetical protein
MIKIGEWEGYYSFNDERLNKLRGFEKTLFQVEILDVKENKFSGTIKDDLTTGGMEGIGEISGEVKGDRIYFVKQMPVMTLIVDRKGTRKTYNKKHRPIYYIGQFSKDGETISGTWRFKFGFIQMGIFPIPVFPKSGIWWMSKKR